MQTPDEPPPPPPPPAGTVRPLAYATPAEVTTVEAVAFVVIRIVGLLVILWSLQYFVWAGLSLVDGSNLRDMTLLLQTGVTCILGPAAGTITFFGARKIVNLLYLNAADARYRDAVPAIHVHPAWARIAFVLLGVWVLSSSLPAMIGSLALVVHQTYDDRVIPVSPSSIYIFTLIESILRTAVGLALVFGWRYYRRINVVTRRNARYYRRNASS